MMLKTVAFQLVLAVLLLTLSSNTREVESWGFSSTSNNHHHHPKKVLLTEVKVLNFRPGQMSTARRGSPVPQLRCVGGNACNEFVPDIVNCKNSGFDGVDVAWECKATMPDQYRFGSTDVTCEGFDYPEDPYILTGSCGLEYTLNRVGGNGKEQPRHDPFSDIDKHRTHGYGYGYGGGTSKNPWIKYLFVALVVYAIYRFVNSSSSSSGDPSGMNNNNDGTQRFPPGGPPGGGGGGGGGGGYSFPGSGSGPPGSCSPNAGAYGSPPYAQPMPPGQGNNGFWTGAGVGGLMGMLGAQLFGGRPRMGYGNYGAYGNYGGMRSRQFGNYRSGLGAGGLGFGGSSFMGGGGGGGSSFGRSSSGGSSSRTSTSTGFGGTRRR